MILKPGEVWAEATGYFPLANLEDVRSLEKAPHKTTWVPTLNPLGSFPSTYPVPMPGKALMNVPALLAKYQFAHLGK